MVRKNHYNQISNSMDFIPLDPTEDDLSSLINSAMSFPFKYIGINHPGDYENECIIFEVTEDDISLYEYIFIYSVEEPETGLPIYHKCRLLTFDEIELQKGSILQIYTKCGEDTTAIEFETAAIKVILHWCLEKPIWHVPNSSFELMRRSASYSGGLQ